MKIAIRVDASSQIGAGHIMRCLTLADELKQRGAQIRFVSRHLPIYLRDSLATKGHEFVSLDNSAKETTSDESTHACWLGTSQNSDAQDTLRALADHTWNWLIVDHYALDTQWESALRQLTKNILAIDDLADRQHDCDVLLDQNYSPGGKQRYATLVPPSCQIFLGPSYALLRQEFRSIRECLKPRPHELKRILIFFTAGNDQGETLKAMQGIELFGKAEHVDVVVGQSNPGNAEIIKKCNEFHWGYHCQVNYMPGLIAQADLVIGAGGSSNWERCALGIPALVAILAENQAPIAQALGQAGIVLNLGWNSNLQAQDYANALATLNHDCLAAMSEKALALVDTKGAERMADILLAA